MEMTPIPSAPEKEAGLPVLTVLTGLACAMPAGWRQAYAEKGFALFEAPEDARAHEKELLEMTGLLRQGKSCVYVPRGLSERDRRRAVHACSGIACRRECVFFLKAPEELFGETPEIPKELLRFQPPAHYEGWEEVRLVPEGTGFAFPFAMTETFDQKNAHHTLFLLDHLRGASRIVQEKAPEKPYLSEAALFHDVGKVFTRTFGPEGQAHYYGHENCSSYLFLLDALAAGRLTTQEGRRKALYTADLIACHMRPLTWDSLEKERKRDREKFGEAMYEDLCLLHEGDTGAK